MINALKKAESGVETRLVYFDPETAQRYLAWNGQNRKMSKATVDRYAKAMTAGKWVANGETIKMSASGALIDGQHRLQAVVKSGETVPMFVMTGLDHEAFKTIDIGRKRTGGDILSIYSPEYGGRNRRVLASTLRLLASFSANGVFNQASLHTFDHTDMIDVLERNPQIIDSIDYAQNMKDASRLCPVPCLAVLHYLFKRKDPANALKFFYWLDTGLEIEKGNPVAALRSRLLNIRRQSARVDTPLILPYVVRAWQHLREGEECQNLRIPGDYIPIIR